MNNQTKPWSADVRTLIESIFLSSDKDFFEVPHKEVRKVLEDIMPERTIGSKMAKFGDLKALDPKNKGELTPSQMKVRKAIESYKPIFDELEIYIWNGEFTVKETYATKNKSTSKNAWTNKELIVLFEDVASNGSDVSEITYSDVSEAALTFLASRDADDIADILYILRKISSVNKGFISSSTLKNRRVLLNTVRAAARRCGCTVWTKDWKEKVREPKLNIKDTNVITGTRNEWSEESIKRICTSALVCASKTEVAIKDLDVNHYDLKSAAKVIGCSELEVLSVLNLLITLTQKNSLPVMYKGMEEDINKVISIAQDFGIDLHYVYKFEDEVLTVETLMNSVDTIEMGEYVTFKKGELAEYLASLS